MEALSSAEKTNLLAAFGMIVLSVAAVVAFVYGGGGAVFYLVTAVAMALGFYMAYRISREPAREKPAPEAPKGRRRATA